MSVALRDLAQPVEPETHQRACTYRLGRVRAQLVGAGGDAALLYDPVNIRYATDTTNMQIWTMHNAARYALVFAHGPVVLYEFHGCAHLHDGNAQIDEIRPAVNWSYFGSGTRAREKAAEWARDLVAVLARHGALRARLAVDRAAHEGLTHLAGAGIALVDGEALLEEARKVKSADELELVRWTLRVCETGVERMHDELRAGMTEQELWALLHYENIRQGGVWIETRLLSSGPRTNPWMQEASDRVMQTGELIGFDTDLIGPYGYCADISRTWTVGHTEPTSTQRELYRLAHDQIVHNIALLGPGVAYSEVSRKAWPIPEKFYPQRYSFLLHGVGLCDENPGVAHWGEDWDRAGYDGVFEPGNTVCVESYIGEVGGREGVKLEQQVLVTDTGVEPLTTCPFNDW